jgi:hypothetical protein
LLASLLKKGLSENSSNNAVGVITTLLKKGLTEKPSNEAIGMITMLFKKILSESVSMFEFEHLIPEPYRRDQPAQRLQHNGCGTTLLKKGLLTSLSKKSLSKNSRRD